MASQARKVFGAFEKRAPAPGDFAGYSDFSPPKTPNISKTHFGLETVHEEPPCGNAIAIAYPYSCLRFFHLFAQDSFTFFHLLSLVSAELLNCTMTASGRTRDRPGQHTAV